MPGPKSKSPLQMTIKLQVHRDPSADVHISSGGPRCPDLSPHSMVLTIPHWHCTQIPPQNWAGSEVLLSKEQ